MNSCVPATVHHRTVRIDGLDVFYREAGDPDAPTVVLLHGMPTSSFMFRNLIPLLSDRYHVVAPDMIGFGFSSAPAADAFDYTFDSLAEMEHRLLDELGIGTFSLYVQDYGAPMGWRLALRDPDRITAIVSQNGNAYEEGFVPSFWDPLWTYARNPDDESLAGPLRRSLDLDMIRWQYLHGVADPETVSPDTWHHDHAMVNRPGNPEIQLRLYADYPSNARQYPAVQEYFRTSQVPLLAVWGRNDEIFGPAGAEAFRRDLPAARVHLLSGGHFLLESRLHTVADLMRGFLAGVTEPA
ncbi:alpha/beta fold hydrolase [Streptomyces sp. NPDC014724]|uniref:alpha/beta fold hydrolase n=1 Tax=unclassified Streptomyces TaxID=2593676 RepID=UPI0037000BC7